jgi:D-lactate dehydrogenase
METIAFFEVEEWEKEYLHKAFPNDKLLFSEEKAHDASLAPEFYQATIISTFIYSQLSPEILQKFPNVKIIATRSTGYDHIDINYCQSKNITVVNVPSYGAHTVAEHTFALILALSRKLVRTVNRAKRGDFELHDLTGFDLAGKTIGVIGAGKIGDKVVRLSRAFEMNVLLYTRHPEEVAGKEGIKAVDLDELFANSDIVTLHVPYTKETHHMINKENIQKFKKGSILINTARGPLIETEAILHGLESGILKGAGLDVLEEECGLKEERELLTTEFFKSCDIKTQLMDHMLISRDDVLYTSHNGFNSTESVHQILDVTIENMQNLLQGKPSNIVAPK